MTFVQIKARYIIYEVLVNISVSIHIGHLIEILIHRKICKTVMERLYTRGILQFVKIGNLNLLADIAGTLLLYIAM